MRGMQNRQGADMITEVTAMNNIQNNPEYQSALRPVNSNYDRLQQALTNERKDLLMRCGFKLGAGLVMETIT